MPPTHRTLALLADCDDGADVARDGRAASPRSDLPALVRTRRRRRDDGARAAGRSGARRSRATRVPGRRATSCAGIDGCPRTRRADAARGAEPTRAAPLHGAGRRALLRGRPEDDPSLGGRREGPALRTEGRHLRFRRNDVVRVPPRARLSAARRAQSARPTVVLAGARDRRGAPRRRSSSRRASSYAASSAVARDRAPARRATRRARRRARRSSCERRSSLAALKANRRRRGRARRRAPPADPAAPAADRPRARRPRATATRA